MAPLERVASGESGWTKRGATTYQLYTGDTNTPALLIDMWMCDFVGETASESSSVTPSLLLCCLANNETMLFLALSRIRVGPAVGGLMCPCLMGIMGWSEICIGERHAWNVSTLLNGHT